MPIGPTGNQLAIIDLSEGKRLSGGFIPHLICGHNIGDFDFDPFDDYRVAIGCDNGTIQIWQIPENGLNDSLSNYKTKLVSHNDRLTIVKFHPTSANVLASFAQDLNLIIWDLECQEPQIEISQHPEVLFGLAWSPDGNYLATLCKDQKLRIFEPRFSPEIKQEGPACQGSRGGRVCWAQDGKLLVVSGFSR